MRDSGTRTTADGDEGPADELPDGEARNEAQDEDEAVDTSHLDDVEDGCGCAEVWEHLSEERDD